MENQKDQQEQTLSQESLQSLEEEQLQDVAGAGGGGGWEKVLACFTCGAFQQRSASLVLSTGLNNVPAHHGTAGGSHPNYPSTPSTPSNSPVDSPSGSPILGVIHPSSPTHGVVFPQSSAYGRLRRSASMPAEL